MESSTIRRAAVLSACLLGAAGCGSEPDVEARNASVAEVAEQVREASGEKGFIRPGRWVSQMTLEEMNAPGMPPEVAQQMRGMIGGAGQQFESCLTEEQANRPTEEFFAGANQHCRYEHFTMGGGKIDATMRCAQGGISQVMEMDGTYSPDSYQISMANRLEGSEGPGAGMTMRMRVDARRAGECRSGQS